MKLGSQVTGRANGHSRVVAFVDRSETEDEYRLITHTSPKRISYQAEVAQRMSPAFDLCDNDRESRIAIDMSCIQDLEMSSQVCACLLITLCEISHRLGKESDVGRTDELYAATIRYETVRVVVPHSYHPDRPDTSFACVWYGCEHKTILAN